MKDGRVANVLRERGYEALFLLTGCVAMSLRPTIRGAISVEDAIGEILMRRKETELLRGNGLVASSERSGEKFLRLTESGARSFAGGRQPEKEWGRSWDGQWRLLAFDIPRDAKRARTKFWRWLRAHHFGRLQGSVWIGCEPVPGLDQAVQDAGLDPSAVVLFTGQVEGQVRPRDVVAEAWDFATIKAGYQDYIDFAEQAIGRSGREDSPKALLRAVLAEDRKKWWAAIRRDPLLPRELLPRDYIGMQAWKERHELHAKLFRALDLDRL